MNFVRVLYEYFFERLILISKKISTFKGVLYYTGLLNPLFQRPQIYYLIKILTYLLFSEISCVCTPKIIWLSKFKSKRIKVIEGIKEIRFLGVCQMRICASKGLKDFRLHEVLLKYCLKSHTKKWRSYFHDVCVQFIRSTDPTIGNIVQKLKQTGSIKAGVSLVHHRGVFWVEFSNFRFVVVHLICALIIAAYRHISHT